jgi:hypothetical protein
MSKQIPSQDSHYDDSEELRKIWEKMDKIEPLTSFIPNKIDDYYQAYREAALSDSYMFGEYDGYEAYKQED